MLFENSYEGLSRELDCFFTNKATVDKCLEVLSDYIDFGVVDLWVEPSAGAGAFLHKLPHPRIGMDVRPEGEDILRHDFLQWYPSDDNENIVVVGNPPFGKNSRLAVNFFNRSSLFARYIAMVLPKTFRKRSVVNRLNRRFHLICEHDLLSESFEFMGRPYSVPCVFQIWEKRGYAREYLHETLGHPDFNFVDRYSADFAIQRVGANAGRIKREYSRFSSSSHYFIKSVKSHVFSVFSLINWDSVKYNTSGNPSISKGEVVSLYSEELNSYVF